MAAAVAGPTPGNVSRSVDVAVLRSKGATGPAASAASEGEPAAGPAGDDPTATGTSACPIAGTYTRMPSASGAARFTRSTSAEAAAPPACSMASAVREPAGSVTRPGWTTAPATCTTNGPGTVV